MTEIYNFSAGPAQLPDEIKKEASCAELKFNNTGIGISETSHRLDEFAEVLSIA